LKLCVLCPTLRFLVDALEAGKFLEHARQNHLFVIGCKLLNKRLVDLDSVSERVDVFGEVFDVFGEAFQLLPQLRKHLGVGGDGERDLKVNLWRLEGRLLKGLKRRLLGRGDNLVRPWRLCVEDIVIQTKGEASLLGIFQQRKRLLGEGVVR